MKPYTVDVIERAWRELAWENANWNFSLPRAKPDTLIEVFDQGLDLLAEDPAIGGEDQDRPGGGYRRLLRLAGKAQRVGFWMYYRVDHARERVEVVSFRSTKLKPPTDL